MGLFDRFPFGQQEKVSKPKPQVGAIYVRPTSSLSYQSEKVKSIVPKETGGRLGAKGLEEHPFDFQMTEDLYKEFGLVTAVVDKYVDFVVGGGFFVKSEDPRCQEIIEDFLLRINFDTILRAWTKEALIKGNGFLELGATGRDIDMLKVIDAKTMFVKRDKFGVVEGYKQIIGGGSRQGKGGSEGVEFKPNEIAHVKFDKVGNMAYGLGIVAPSLLIINSFLQANKDMHEMLSRKANSPYVVTLGDRDKEIIPSESDVNRFGEKLEFLKNDQEWVVDAFTKIEALDFGNVGDKFLNIAEFDLQMLAISFQVPSTLLGLSGVREAIAEVQMAAFERRVQSMQSELERVIETNIFEPILEAAGMVDCHVEFEWGEPSEEETNARVLKITEILKNPLIASSLRMALQEELARLLNIEVDIEEQPVEPVQEPVPGENEEPEANNQERPSAERWQYEPLDKPQA